MHLYYEKCLYSLSIFDQNNLRVLLKKWPKKQYLPFFEVKRAALLAELGELHEAKEITETALDDDSVQTSHRPNNYLFLSQEGWTMLLLQSIQSEELFQSQKFSEAFSVHSQFRDRWDRLAIYNCNPWQEIKKLQFILKNTPPSNYLDIQLIWDLIRAKLLKHIIYILHRHLSKHLQLLHLHGFSKELGCLLTAGIFNVS